MLCSEVKVSYDSTGVTFHGTSATDNIVLTIAISKHFFNIYDGVESLTFRVNIYHLHKIIKRVTSFMYHTIHIHIYGGHTNEKYSWMHLLFETQNRTDQFHTRIYPILEYDPIMCVDHLAKMSPSQVIKLTVNGDDFIGALERFDKDMFQSISFAFRKNKNGNHKQHDTSKYHVDVCGETNNTLVIRSRTDSITGRVRLRSSNCCRGDTKQFAHLRHFKYSLEMLSKSSLFYKLSKRAECTLQIFPQFKVVCLQFRLPHDVMVDIILPQITEGAHDETSSASDSDS